jgi:hypothetical protein
LLLSVCCAGAAANRPPIHQMPAKQVTAWQRRMDLHSGSEQSGALRTRKEEDRVAVAFPAAAEQPRDDLAVGVVPEAEAAAVCSCSFLFRCPQRCRCGRHEAKTCCPPPRPTLVVDCLSRSRRLCAGSRPLAHPRAQALTWVPLVRLWAEAEASARPRCF